MSRAKFQGMHVRPQCRIKMSRDKYQGMHVQWEWLQVTLSSWGHSQQVEGQLHVSSGSQSEFIHKLYCCVGPTGFFTRPRVSQTSQLYFLHQIGFSTPSPLTGCKIKINSVCWFPTGLKVPREHNLASSVISPYIDEFETIGRAFRKETQDRFAD